MIKPTNTTNIKVILLTLIFIALGIVVWANTSKNQFLTTNPLPTPPPTPSPNLIDIPKENNPPYAIVNSEQIGQKQFIFYDRERSELFLLNDNKKSVIYAGRVDSYAFLNPTVYIFDKSQYDQITEINITDNTARSIKLPDAAPLDFITQCSDSTSLVIIGKYSATKRTASILLTNPSFENMTTIVSTTTATSVECAGNNIILFSQADSIGASKIEAVSLTTGSVLLRDNGNEYRISNDGTLIAIENDGISIFDLTSGDTYAVPDTSQSHFIWLDHNLLLINNLHPGISAKMIDKLGNSKVIHTPNQNNVVVRKLLQTLGSSFIYQSGDGTIKQELIKQE